MTTHVLRTCSLLALGFISTLAILAAVLFLSAAAAVTFGAGTTVKLLLLGLLGFVGIARLRKDGRQIGTTEAEPDRTGG